MKRRVLNSSLWRHGALFLIIAFFTSGFVAPCLSFAQDSTSGIREEYLSKNLLQEQQIDDAAGHRRLRLPGVGEVAFKMFFFLAVVLLFMFGLALAFQKLFKGKGTENNVHHEVIRVLSYRKFDLKRGMYLVEVLGKVLVIGADIDGLNLITEITDSEQITRARQMTEVRPDLFTFNPFHNLLDGFTRQYSEENMRERKKDREARGLFKKLNELKSRLKT